MIRTELSGSDKPDRVARPASAIGLSDAENAVVGEQPLYRHDVVTGE